MELVTASNTQNMTQFVSQAWGMWHEFLLCPMTRAAKSMTRAVATAGATLHHFAHLSAQVRSDIRGRRRHMASSQCGPQIIGATGGVCHNNAYMQMVVGPVVAAKLPRCLETFMNQASSLGTRAVEAAFAICAASVLVDDDVCVCVCVCWVCVFV